MFRTRVLYVWLQMVGTFIGLLLLVAIGAAMFDADVGFPMMLALFLVLGAGAVGVAIAGAFPMLLLMQYLLIAAGARAGRPILGFFAAGSCATVWCRQPCRYWRLGCPPCAKMPGWPACC